MRRSVARGIQHLLLAVALAFLATSLCHAQKGRADVYGVWAQGNTILVFANVDPCSHCCPPPGVAVMLASTDGGRTWKKGGPSLAGYEFGFMYEKDGKVWIAGEHTCEGPSIDPFVFVPVGENKWEFHTIDRGNEMIDHLGWGSNGELIAWITEISLDDLEPRATRVHQSLDDGRTWKELGLARKHKVPVKAEFMRITPQMQPLWRVVEMKKSDGFLVQHRDSESAHWKTVSRFTPWNCPRTKPEEGR